MINRNLSKEKKLLYKAIQINPNYADAHYNLGIVHKKLGEYEKAIACYEKAIQIKPDYAVVYNNLATILGELNNMPKAKKYYEKALDLNPNIKEAYLGYGNILLKLNQHKKGLDNIRKGSGFIRFSQKNFTII